MIILDKVAWTRRVKRVLLLVCLCIVSLSFLLLPVRGGEEGKEKRLRSWHGHILTDAEKKKNQEYLNELRDYR